MPKVYAGYRQLDGCRVFIETGDRRRALNPRNDLADHSPDGFEWGYAGSGPAQLALAILADALSDDARALALYQFFKFRVVVAFPPEGWLLSIPEVLKHVAVLEDGVARRSHTSAVVT